MGLNAKAKCSFNCAIFVFYVLSFSGTSKFYQPVLVPPITLYTSTWGYEMVPSGLFYGSSMGGEGHLVTHQDVFLN